MIPTPERELLKGGARGGFSPDQAHVYDWQSYEPSLPASRLGSVTGLGADDPGGSMEQLLRRLGPVGTGIVAGLATGALRGGFGNTRAMAIPAAVGAGLGYLAKEQGTLDVGIAKLDIRGNPMYVALGVFLATMFMPIPSGE